MGSRNSGRKGPGRDYSSAEAISTAERHAEWLRKRKSGMTYRAIAAEAGVAPNAVWEAVTNALKEVRGEPAEELLKLELERIDSLIETVWPVATCTLDPAHFDDQEQFEEGSRTRLDYIEQARKLLADRRKLLGVEGATKVQHSFEGLSDDDLAKRLAELGVQVNIKGSGE